MVAVAVAIPEFRLGVLENPAGTAELPVLETPVVDRIDKRFDFSGCCASDENDEG